MTLPLLNVLYLVHDLSDPATRRRVAMLQAGGARVTLAGFRRSEEPVDEIEGVKPIDVGRTHDGRFAQRLGAVASVGLSAGAKFAGIPQPDIIVARSLEMLALARQLKNRMGGNIPIAYECLDIHRLMLRRDAVGSAMRAAERWLGRDVVLLLTSSPAFIREYFEREGQSAAPVHLLENKVFDLSHHAGTAARPSGMRADGPWRIGWFGALRCQRSLSLLGAFTRAMDGRFEVVLRGRPADGVFDDFEATVAAEPFISFEGPYRNPEDLADIYGAVDFTWTVDFFEEGLNSSWLLPNRLYEGCRHGAVPIAMRNTEVGRFLAARQMGLLLEKGAVDDLASALGPLSKASFIDQRATVEAEPVETWICGPKDCQALVTRLRAATEKPTTKPMLEAAE